MVALDILYLFIANYWPCCENVHFKGHFQSENGFVEFCVKKVKQMYFGTFWNAVFACTSLG